MLPLMVYVGSSLAAHAAALFFVTLTKMFVSLS
jgi:hypothetical protein